jgi:hypothetical protein
MNETASEGAGERRVGIYMPRHDIAAITVGDHDDDDDGASPCVGHATLVTVSLGCHRSLLDSAVEKEDDTL